MTRNTDRPDTARSSIRRSACMRFQASGMPSRAAHTHRPSTFRYSTMRSSSMADCRRCSSRSSMSWSSPAWSWWSWWSSPPRPARRGASSPEVRLCGGSDDAARRGGRDVALHRVDAQELRRHFHAAALRGGEAWLVGGQIDGVHALRGRVLDAGALQMIGRRAGVTRRGEQHQGDGEQATEHHGEVPHV